jgi:predicted DNA-binding transcriptional regulator YafY
LLSSDGRAKDEASIRENLPPYAEIYSTSLAQRGDAKHAIDAVRNQLHRDVAALGGAGITVEVDGTQEGRLYRLPPTGFSPVEVDLKAEERAVLVGALRALRRDFPYAGPLRLALANLIGAASAGTLQGGYEDEAGRITLAAVATRDDEAVARRVAALEGAVSRRKRIRFDYYSISRDETSRREVEPYTLSLLDGSWYLTGRDVRREDLRQFRLSRIRGCIVFATMRDGGDFDAPEDFECRLAGPRAPWQLGEPDHTARIRIPGRVFDAARASYGEAVSLQEDDESAVLVTRYSGERQLAGWGLSLGEDAEILSPDSLVDRTVDGLKRLVAAHGGVPS